MTGSGLFQGAVARWLAAHGEGSRRQGSAALSATYRAGGSSKRIDLAAYLVARLPATHAAVSRVLAEAVAARPGLNPRSMLDAGSGPGTAAWAAVEAWPGLERVTFLDNAPDFLKLAMALAVEGPEPLSRAEGIAGTIQALPQGVKADLVVAAYTLAELPVADIPQAAAKLWSASTHLLVLVEPGTPQGFARIRAARAALLEQGAVPVAPCSHAFACPMAGDDWCHFSVRLARSRAHMHAKGASVPFEDERFSYIVLAREGAPLGGARILAPPQHGKPGATFRLCHAGGLESRHIARREGAAYKLVRKLDWGDRMPPDTEEKAP